MNLVFFGSSDFAAPSLKALVTLRHNVACVVTQPDKRKGRGWEISQTAIKETAVNCCLRIFQPQDINNPEAVKFLADLNPALFIVVSYGHILPSSILTIPKIFSINLHASLLPRYRGAAPINWAIINGEKETGLTIIKMNDKMDSGEIILQKKIDIDNVDTAVSLEEKLAREGADLLLECIDKIEKNNFQLLPQDEAGVSFAPKLKKKDGLINWHAPAEGVQNLIRGTFDWPGAFTYYNGKLLKIFKAYVYRFKDLPASRIAGEIIKVSREGIIVATGSDNLIIEELQIEGGRRMRVEEFISGHKIYPQERFSSVP